MSTHTLTHTWHVHLLHTHTYIHIHMHTEPSLTLDTLSSVLDNVQRLGDSIVGDYLQIPNFKLEEFKRQYDRRQLPRVYSTVFLTDNPSPSWSTIALALWEVGEHGALEVVQKLYLKGEPCINTHLYIIIVYDTRGPCSCHYILQFVFILTQLSSILWVCLIRYSRGCSPWLPCL